VPEVDAEQRRQAAAVAQVLQVVPVEPAQQEDAVAPQRQVELEQLQPEVDAVVVRPPQLDRLTPWLFDSRQPESS
jgi:hypothetical protein